MTSLQKSRLKQAIKRFRSGKLAEADRLCSTILGKEPDNTGALSLLADIALERGDFNSRLAALDKIVSLRPEQPVYQFNLGMAFLQADMPEKAIQCLRTSVRLKPDFGEAHSRLCGTAGQLGKLEEAVIAGETAVHLIPNSVVAQLNLATAYDAIGRTQLALHHYKLSSNLAPDNPVIRCVLGDALIGAGARQEAERSYRKAIELQPQYTPPYRQLSRLHKYTTAANKDFSRISNLLKDTSIAESARSHLHFALGKMYEDCGLYNESFQHLEIANQIENKKHNFNPGAFTAFASDVISFYTSDFLENRASIGDPSTVPVFIVGMPRSGSTLVEQIIACHPQGFGGGELYWFGQIEHKLRNIISTSDPYPVCVRNLDVKSSRSLAGEYLEYLGTLSEDGNYARITDKLLGNFMHLGLITLLFRNARIIHCRRNPLDTCFSIYSILFPGNLNFSHDLKNIGLVYNQYTRLMQHWETVMPTRIMTVDYEDLVQNQESASRRLIDFIGLSWDDACLDFSRNKNRVRTVSAFQVRKGMYTSAVGRWTHFEKHLEPLFETLDPEVLERALSITRPSY